jgi:hypothetical protein
MIIGVYIDDRFVVIARRESGPDHLYPAVNRPLRLADIDHGDDSNKRAKSALAAFVS